MYLSNVRLVNFRNLKDFSIDLQPGLTVILGENNIGKSNLLDAIRIVLNSGGEGRDIWASLEDRYHSEDGVATTDSFEIHLTFADLGSDDWAHFNPCRVRSGSCEVAQIHFRYRKQVTRRNLERGRPEIWVGETEGTEVEPDVMAEIKATFLPALRNVEADLRPGRNNRVSRLLAEVASSDEMDDMVQLVRRANEDIQNQSIIARATEIVNQSLGTVTGRVRPLVAQFALSDPQFQDITNALRVLVGRQRPAEINENGLGYNNILYISTVLGELSRSVDNQVTLPILLIEEPEAHLHPQLQVRLIDYLVNREDEKVQIILTSHSPTLASRFPLDKVVIIAEGRSGPHRGHIVAKPIGDCGLSLSQKSDLQRYLDITRSTLFFSRGVILVEGISEALLFPVLARKMGVDLALHDVTVVNVSSLAFEPFVKLFQNGSLDIPCSLVTDADPSVSEDERTTDSVSDDLVEYPEKVDCMSATAQKLVGLAQGQVRVFLACKTFEYDLALASPHNAATMTSVFKNKLGHPNIGKSIELELARASTCRESAKAFFLPSIGKYPQEKAVFAQGLATHLEPKEMSFDVPVYIQDAIYHAIDAYSLYEDGICKVVPQFETNGEDYEWIVSKDHELKTLINGIRCDGIDDRSRSALSQLVAELDGFCAERFECSFRQLCGLASETL